MSQAKWVVVNGIKYVNPDVHATTYTEQTEEDVQKTTKNIIYFKNYIVTKSNDGMSFKRRKIH